MTSNATTAGDTTGTAEIELTVLDHPDHTLISLHGDLDIATTPSLRERLLILLRHHHSGGTLILDLSGVAFCDTAGLAVLIGTRRRAALLGIRLRLVAPRPQVAKLLHATGLDRNLTIHQTIPHPFAA